MRHSITIKSVRDLPQQIKIKDNIITVISKVGRKKASSYSFFIDEWSKIINYPTANPEYNYVQFISKKLRDTAKLDNTTRGECITQRIIDTQISGIKKILNKAKSEEK